MGDFNMGPYGNGENVGDTDQYKTFDFFNWAQGCQISLGAKYQNVVKYTETGGKHAKWP
jgi:hypothetical protein